MLLDTHVWVWATMTDRRLGPRTRRLLSRSASATVYVSAVSVFELTTLHTSGRLRLAQPVESWIRDSIDRGGLRVLELVLSIAGDAGAIPRAALQDPIDRLLVASARYLRAPLVTADRRILDYSRTTGLVTCADALQ
jgi:PIN domain nuclease of toxin-antitoxin system